eukprot:gene5531-6090_t
MSHSTIPTFLRGSSVLVPIKIDLTYQGARLVDTFCWDIYNESTTPEEFVSRTCSDLNLPIGFQHRITAQIIEQIQSYRLLVNFIREYHSLIPDWEKKVIRCQSITIGIRHNSIDYSDRIEWNPMDEYLTPELFARSTCYDLGLASEIEAAIGHKIRESLFRWLINLVEKPNLPDGDLQPEFKVTDNKISLVPPNQVVDMTTNLWKRAKPASLDDISSVPQPMLPSEKESTAPIWLKKLNL